MRVLIVDDSIVFRTQIKNAIESSLKVDYLATAANGKIALQKLEQEKFDVMTLDLEMPEMNGMETLQAIKDKGISVKVVIFAAQTARGAKTAMEALRNGAVDVVPKPSGDTLSFEHALSQVKEQLIPILIEFGSGRPIQQDAPIAPSAASQPSESKELHFNIQSKEYTKVRLEQFKPKVVVIGSSTGGPNALEVMFANVRAPSRVPILIVQHMPPVFTATLASRIAGITGIEAAEAQNGEVIQSNRIYVAPGDFHMGLYHAPAGISIKLSQSPKRCNVRPAVDVLFEDVAQIYENTIGAVILTGMGEDGMLGCRAIKEKGGGVLIQDKATCVVWGMPGAVHAAGAFDKMSPLQECARVLNDWVRIN